MTGGQEGSSRGFPHQGTAWAIAGVLILAGILLFLFAGASTGGSRFGGGMMYGGGGAFGWFAVAAALLMVGGFLLVVFLVLLFWRAVASPVPWHRFPPGPEDPLTTLKRRYAQGEISKDQFDRMTRDLASVR